MGPPRALPRPESETWAPLLAESPRVLASAWGLGTFQPVEFRHKRPSTLSTIRLKLSSNIN